MSGEQQVLPAWPSASAFTLGATLAEQVLGPVAATRRLAAFTALGQSMMVCYAAAAAPSPAYAPPLANGWIAVPSGATVLLAPPAGATVRFRAVKNPVADCFGCLVLMEQVAVSGPTARI